MLESQKRENFYKKIFLVLTATLTNFIYVYIMNLVLQFCFLLLLLLLFCMVTFVKNDEFFFSLYLFCLFAQSCVKIKMRTRRAHTYANLCNKNEGTDKTKKKIDLSNFFINIKEKKKRRVGKFLEKFVCLYTI